MRGRNLRIYALLALLVIGIGAVLAGCSAANEDSLSSASFSNSDGEAQSSATDDAGVEVGRAEGTANDEGGAGDSAPSGSSGTADSISSEAGNEGTGIIGNVADDAGFNRKLVYRANVAMQVEDYGAAQSQISNAITLSGGYIVKFSDQQTAHELGGTYTIKVPAKGFMSFLAGIENIEHKALEKSLQGTDVTEEYVDLEARLKARQVVEARLLSFMDKATKADDLLKFSTELGEVQTEIERIKGRMRYLDQNVAFSTVELRVYQQSVTPIQEAKEESGFGQRLSERMERRVVLYRECRARDCDRDGCVNSDPCRACGDRRDRLLDLPKPKEREASGAADAYFQPCGRPA
ncbi:hypothetical protein FHS18_001098 [Paenibacillus phyllosphaerae]|uniref:DUF4349 domain-containing protein n=1 Tax=Paenibacillus phyllosphaerae TaxID=274593 RepID=A0A7W5FLD0_9BACL|nr:DUF4349 domain-containing protein [Paenibacillus phyllosphaerae]MBB3109046.1 hypothetical protein [Paenibacillus phyllosphaerae]